MRTPKVTTLLLLAALACPGPSAPRLDPPDLAPHQATFTEGELLAALYSSWRTPEAFYAEADPHARVILWLDENDIAGPDDRLATWPKQLCTDVRVKAAEWLNLDVPEQVIEEDTYWEVQGGVTVWRIHKCETFDTASEQIAGVQGLSSEATGVPLGTLSLAQRTPEALAAFVQRLWRTSGEPLETNAVKVLSTLDETLDDGTLAHVLMLVVGEATESGCDRVMLFEDRFELATDGSLSQTRSVVDEIEGDCDTGGCG